MITAALTTKIGGTRGVKLADTANIRQKITEQSVEPVIAMLTDMLSQALSHRAWNTLAEKSPTTFVQSYAQLHKLVYPTVTNVNINVTHFTELSDAELLQQIQQKHKQLSEPVIDADYTEHTDDSGESTAP